MRMGLSLSVRTLFLSCNLDEKIVSPLGRIRTVAFPFDDSVCKLDEGSESGREVSEDKCECICVRRAVGPC